MWSDFISWLWFSVVISFSYQSINSWFIEKTHMSLNIDYLICESWRWTSVLIRHMSEGLLNALSIKEGKIITFLWFTFVMLPHFVLDLHACIFFLYDLKKNVVWIPCNQFQVHSIIFHESLRCQLLLFLSHINFTCDLETAWNFKKTYHHHCNLSSLDLYGC